MFLPTIENPSAFDPGFLINCTFLNIKVFLGVMVFNFVVVKFASDSDSFPFTARCLPFSSIKLFDLVTLSLASYGTKR